MTLVETGEIPAAEKLKAKFPPSLVEVTRVPGPRGEDGAPAARRARGRGPRGAEGGRRGGADPGHQGPRPEGRGERARLARDACPTPATSPSAACSPRCCRSPRSWPRRCEALPASGRVEIAGSARRWAETCKDIDLVATATTRPRWRRPLAEHALIAQAGSAGDAGASVLTHTGVKVDLRVAPEETFGNLLQHFTGSAEHNVQLRERAQATRPLGLRARGHRDDPRRARRRSPKVHRFADEAGVYELLGLALHRARAARGPRRDRGRRRGRAARAGHARATSAATCTRHTTLSDGRNSLEEMAAGRPQARLRLPRDHRPLGQPRLRRPRHAEALAKRIEEVAKLERGPPQASGCSPAPRSTSAPTARSTTPTSCWPSSTGSSPASTPRSDLREGDDRAGASPRSAIPLVDCIGHLTGPAAAAPRALRDRRRARRRGRGGERDDDRDQRQPEPPRPLGAPRAARRRGRGDDLLQHRRPRRRHAREHAVLGSRPRAAPGSAPTRSPTPARGGRSPPSANATGLPPERRRNPASPDAKRRRCGLTAKPSKPRSEAAAGARRAPGRGAGPGCGRGPRARTPSPARRRSGRRRAPRSRRPPPRGRASASAPPGRSRCRSPRRRGQIEARGARDEREGGERPQPAETRRARARSVRHRRRRLRARRAAGASPRRRALAAPDRGRSRPRSATRPPATISVVVSSPRVGADHRDRGERGRRPGRRAARSFAAGRRRPWRVTPPAPAGPRGSPRGRRRRGRRSRTPRAAPRPSPPRCRRVLQHPVLVQGAQRREPVHVGAVVAARRGPPLTGRAGTRAATAMPLLIATSGRISSTLRPRWATRPFHSAPASISRARDSASPSFSEPRQCSATIAPLSSTRMPGPLEVSAGRARRRTRARRRRDRPGKDPDAARPRPAAAARSRGCPSRRSPPARRCAGPRAPAGR